MMIGAAAALLGSRVAAASNERRPAAGDLLVHSMGPDKGRTVVLEELPLGGPSVLAFPKDRASDTVLDGSRFNEVVLVRLDPAELSEETRGGAAAGVVAYSIVCSHEGCPVSMWNDHEKMMVCSCHGSLYDPRDRAAVVFGPAPRRLAQLPLKIEDGRVVVAGPFQGRLGIYKPA